MDLNQRYASVPFLIFSSLLQLGSGGLLQELNAYTGVLIVIIVSTMLYGPARRF